MNCTILQWLLVALVWLGCGLGIRAIYLLGKSHYDAKRGGDEA